MDSGSYLKKAQTFTINEDGLLGKVLIGYASKLSGTLCLIDTTAINNLPQEISVNCCLVHPKGSVVLVLVINQNNYNIWIWQPLLAAEMYWVEHLPCDYVVQLHCEGENIEVAFKLQ